MHQSVSDNWESFSRPLEGRVHGMYCDILGLVTCAVGNLIDPISLAEQLPWTLEDGTLADLAQVRADWHKLKDNSGHYAKLHYKYALAATKVRLTDQAIDELVARKRDQFFAYLKKNHFPAIDLFPADAQLGIMSMAWACGPGFPAKFGNFKRAVLAQDWEAAVATCKIREAGNPGVVPRNAKNRFCFHNAALVKSAGADVAALHWPNVAVFDDATADAEIVAKADAAMAAATKALDHFVAVERERMLDEGPSASRDLRDWEEADDGGATEPEPIT